MSPQFPNLPTNSKYFNPHLESNNNWLVFLLFFHGSLATSFPNHKFHKQPLYFLSAVLLFLLLSPQHLHLYQHPNLFLCSPWISWRNLKCDMIAVDKNSCSRPTLPLWMPFWPSKSSYSLPRHNLPVKLIPPSPNQKNCSLCSRSFCFVFLQLCDFLK